MKWFCTMAALFAVTLSMPVDEASAWSARANFNVSLFGSKFHRVEMRRFYTNQCLAEVTVRFYAPYNVYTKFQVRVTLQSGAWFRSTVFFNNRSGEREFRWEYNTTAQGCWTKSAQRAAYLEVHGCKGSGCTVSEFGY